MKGWIKMKTINEVNDWLELMDEDNKVGWNKKGFQKLSFDDKLAFAVGRFVGQTYNNGVDGFLYNGYDYLIGFLRSEVAETLGEIWLQDFWDDYDNLVDRANHYDYTENEFQLEIEDLNEKIWESGNLDELEIKAARYLQKEGYEHLNHIKEGMILCPRCKIKSKSRRWNGATFVEIRKHGGMGDLTRIQKAIKLNKNNLQYKCPRCKKIVHIIDIKEVNTYE